MNENDLCAYLSTLRRAELAVLVSLFVHEMTISARDTYEVGTENVLDGSRLRAFNEAIHRVADLLCAIHCSENKSSVCERLADYYAHYKRYESDGFHARLVRDFDRSLERFRNQSVCKPREELG